MYNIKQQSLSTIGVDNNKIVGDIFIGETEQVGSLFLLLHGGGQTRFSWEKTAKMFASKGNVAVTIDHRGHGDSDWVKNGRYGAEPVMEDTCRVIEKLYEKYQQSPIIVGASLGGLAGLGVSLFNETRFVKALVLVDIVPNMAKEGVQNILRFMAKHIEDGFASLDEAADAITAYNPHRKKPKSNEGLRKNLRLHADGRYRWHWDPVIMDRITPGDEMHPFSKKLYENMHKITQPVCLVHGSQSDLVTKEAAQEFLDKVPHARYYDVNGAGHMVAGDRNDIFTNAVIQFLEDTTIIENNSR